jgi:hypothetical protein
VVPSVGPARPLAVKLSVGLFAGYWTCSMAYTGVRWLAHGVVSRDAAYLAVWTLIVGAILVTIWRGGPTATRLMSRLGIAVGLVILAGTVVLARMVYRYHLGASPLLLLPALAGGLVLAVAGGLLRRADVREWVAATAARKTGSTLGKTPV